MKIMVIDGNSIINRAFYGIRLLSTRDGLYTNAVYGFLTIMHRLIDEQQPDGICVTFDRREPTFRHERYEGYKATRSGMPDELAVQMPVMKQVLKALGIPIYELPGYEADDLIGTISRRCEQSGYECVAVTGDRDSLQLITDKTSVLLVRTKGSQTLTELYDPQRFTEEYGFGPRGLIDLKALMGDSSDNIPGVAGVGEKTAKDLMVKFGSLNAVYDNIDSADIKDSVRKKLNADKDNAYMSYELAEICAEAPMEFNAGDTLSRTMDRKALYELFMQLEFSKMIEKYGLCADDAQCESNEIYTAEIVSENIQSTERSAELLAGLEKLDSISVLTTPDLEAVALCHDCNLWFVFAENLANEYEKFLSQLFSIRIKKNAHDVKHLMGQLLKKGLPTDGFVFDTALAAYLLDPAANSYSLEKLAMSYFKTEIPPEKDYTQEQATSLLADKSVMIKAFSTHVGIIDLLAVELKSRLEQEGMLELFNTVELPLCNVLAEMEHEGVFVDRAELITFGQALSIRIDDLQNAIWEHAGGSFNINSTKQLGVVLFEDLGLPPVKKTKTGYSTNVDVLNKLKGKHPIIELILEYRTLTKLKSTYADGLLKVISDDGRIHTSFNMTATATGRLSSTEPNLQNIPVRTELGAELRKMFVAAPGKVLVDADYSQIELRVLAHIADDERMTAAFKSGEDIHRVTASQVFGVEPEEVTALMRRSAKAVNFGIVYGISEYSLSEDLGVSFNEAKQYIESYLENYAGVAAFMKNVVADAKESGCVTTLFGRKRWLPELKSGNFNIRSAAERMAMNSPIQGTAADIIKLAMIRVHAVLKERGLRAKLVLQVHDELIVEAPHEEADAVVEILTEQMGKVVTLKAPLVAEAKTGRSWYDAK